MFVASWSCWMQILAVIPSCWTCCGLFWVFSATCMISNPTRAPVMGHLLVERLKWWTRGLFFFFNFCKRPLHLQAFPLMWSFQFAVHNGEKNSRYHAPPANKRQGALSLSAKCSALTGSCLKATALRPFKCTAVLSHWNAPSIVCGGEKNKINLGGVTCDWHFDLRFKWGDSLNVLLRTNSKTLMSTLYISAKLGYICPFLPKTCIYLVF